MRMSSCSISTFLKAACIPSPKGNIRSHSGLSWSQQRYKRTLATKAAASKESAQIIDAADEPASINKPNYVLHTVDVDKNEVLYLHLRRSKKLVPVKAEGVAGDVSFFTPKKKRLYHLDILASSSVNPVYAKSAKNAVVKSPLNLKSLSLTLREPQFDQTNSGRKVEDEVMWRQQKIEIKNLLTNYKMLSKVRLTGLVVLTAMAGYAIAPGAFDFQTFTLCTIGTGLTSCAANSINQYFEVPYDSQMNRTKNRVLVKGQLSPLHATMFASTTGVLGVLLLSSQVNATVAALGAFNLGLYTLCYTPLKRISIINTWIGSVVGAIPPMMGWAACTGSLDAGAFLLGAIMFSWQFPHFNALSWNLRPDYSRAGYRMMSVTDPDLCKRVAFRHCIFLTGLSLMAAPLGVTTYTFSVDSLPLNLYFTYLGWKFYSEGDSNSSRKLFRFSLIHIPALLVLMIMSKKSWGNSKRDSKEHGTISENGSKKSISS